MSPTEHALYGAAASAATVPFFGLPGAISFFLGSIFIDLDHYPDYLYFSKFKSWGIKNMFRFHGEMARCGNDVELLALEAFHTLEFLLAFLAVGLYFKSTIVILIFSGMVFHLGLDLIRLKSWGRTNARAVSFIEYWIRKREMERRGVDPEAPFHQAYRKISQKPGPVKAEIS